ncbi:MAG: hypothetical protein ACI9Y7_001185 [Dokdonia sp.]|jgi:hypothetical protein
MFKNYIAVITFVCICSCATDNPISEPVANVFDGDVELVTQQAVEDFGAMAYTEITDQVQKLWDFGIMQKYLII